MLGQLMSKVRHLSHLSRADNKHPQGCAVSARAVVRARTFLNAVLGLPKMPTYAEMSS